MGNFNFEDFAQTDFNLDNLGVQFGIPACIMNMSKDLLQLLPSPQLGAVSTKLTDGIGSANEDITRIKRQIARSLGIFEIDTFTGKFVLGTGYKTGDKDNKLSDFVGTAQEFLSGGYNMYQNIATPVNQVIDLLNCVGQLRKFDKLQDTGKQGVNKLMIESMIPKLQDSQNFIDKATTQLNTINSVLEVRRLDPSQEPIYNTSVGVITGDDLILHENLASIFINPSPDNSPIFDLIFGPPVSTNGQYILSVDGLYYDSQSGGLPVVSGVIPPGESYLFNFAPNLGGKGQSISLDALSQYADTIFDPNILDDGQDIKIFYDEDNFIQVLEGQKNKQIYDLSANITDLILSGYDPSSAVVINFTQSLYSTAAKHQEKINRRKKQIEIAVRIPQLYGASFAFSPGEIPINDFSYLVSANFAPALERQTPLIFERAEVNDIVLPLRPKFVKAAQTTFAPTITPLLVPFVDEGGIIFSLSGNVSSTSPFMVNLTNGIATDSLIAVYNFLNSKVVSPGSTEFNVINHKVKPEASGQSFIQNAQLIAQDSSSVFLSGLGIPYLQGMTRLSTATVGAISGIGSVIILPQTTEYQNLTYSPEGFAIDLWTYIPRFYTTPGWQAGTSTSALYKILLGCENTGGTFTSNNPNKIFLDTNSNSVRGMLIGFTRDKFLLSGTVNIDSGPDYTLSDGISFFMAPTKSVNVSDVNFVLNATDCNTPSGIPRSSKVKMNISPGSAIDKQFIHIVVNVTPSKDLIETYMEGVLANTDSISNVFGVPVYTPIQLPSFTTSSSFTYNLSTTGNSLFANGPNLGSFFTPFVVGGGWTDGMRFNAAGIPAGNFMGINSGVGSGLFGHIGSLKFYKRALSQLEIISNYRAQKAFFKNIKI
jgi:hypothetical protein